MMVSRTVLVVSCALALLWMPTDAVARTVVDYVETFDDADFGGLWGVHTLSTLGRGPSAGSATAVEDGVFKFTKDGNGGGCSPMLSTSYPGADNAFSGWSDVTYEFTVLNVPTAFGDVSAGPGAQLLFCQGTGIYSLNHVGVAAVGGTIYVQDTQSAFTYASFPASEQETLTFRLVQLGVGPKWQLWMRRDSGAFENLSVDAEGNPAESMDHDWGAGWPDSAHYRLRFEICVLDDGVSQPNSYEIAIDDLTITTDRLTLTEYSNEVAEDFNDASLADGRWMLTQFASTANALESHVDLSGGALTFNSAGDGTAYSSWMVSLRSYDPEPPVDNGLPLPFAVEFSIPYGDAEFFDGSGCFYLRVLDGIYSPAQMLFKNNLVQMPNTGWWMLGWRDEFQTGFKFRCEISADGAAWFLKNGDGPFINVCHGETNADGPWDAMPLDWMPDGNVNFAIQAVDTVAPGSSWSLTIDDLKIYTQGAIADTTPPVIAMNCSSPLVHSLGVPFNPLDCVTATDNVDGDITDQVVVGGDTVDVNTAGTYHITYDVTDTAGNPAAQVTLTVAVQADTDGDGLPDDWEMRYFGNLDQGPDDDPDGDGRSNAQELADGTDPTDGASYLPVAGTLALGLLAAAAALGGARVVRRRR